MINVLNRKLKDEELQANVLCADVQHLDFSGEFETVILPFQSFMELVGKEKQMNTLRSAYRALFPNGRFYCTMHNPFVRRKSIDGIMREVGTFPFDKGYVVVKGIETGGNPVVQRSQYIERFNSTGQLEARIIQPMQFEIVEESRFRELATEAGFIVRTVFGDYEANDFDTETSPVMIWEIQKSEA